MVPLEIIPRQLEFVERRRIDPCVFHGYSLNKSVYIRFDPSTIKTYHSRHVRFIESTFPLFDVNPSLPQSDESVVSTWFSITLVDSALPSATPVVDPASILKN